jgi:hypothetical protein
MAITFPSNTRQIINEIRDAIGRPCEFNVITLNECTASGCSLNPVTGDSTNPFCSICGGEYYYETYSGVIISGHVTWKPSDMMQWYPGGQHFDGDVRIQVEYTIANLNIIDQTDHVVVDGKVVEIKKYTPRGFQDLNRILLDCKERAKTT